MKKLIYILMFVFPVVVFPQWKWQNPLPQGNGLNSTFFTDADNGYAVGDAGTILKTVDGGETWTIYSSGPNNQLNSIYFTDANTGYVAGINLILKTEDAGTSWTTDSSGTWYNLNSVFFTDSTTGYVVGISGTILKTGNGGITFVEEHKQVDTGFTFYPNPANTKITITGTKMVQKDILVTILNIDGEQVMKEEFRNQNLFELDVSSLPKGIYLMKFQSKEGYEVKKLVID